MSTQSSDRKQIQFTLAQKINIIKPYVTDRFMDQVKSVWLIITYLILFQILVLQLPIVDSLMIGTGILIVLLGLMFFMEGLLLGLMPFGEIIGSTLPQKAGMVTILSFAFIVGMGATFAEPAIATLQLAGKYVSPQDAPLLYSLLNEFSTQLVVAVGVGVGIAVIFGVLRFLYQWSLKTLIYPLVAVLAGMTLFAHNNEILSPIIGLAWDCGAVTTGPVTVPLVLALGIGVSRIVSGGSGGGSGFGIVTLASLFPIIAVLFLAFFHYAVDDYAGRPNSALKVESAILADQEVITENQTVVLQGFSQKEFDNYIKTGMLPPNITLNYDGEKKLTEDGRIIVEGGHVIISKKETLKTKFSSLRWWDANLEIGQKLFEASINSIRAIIPLCLFLFIVLRYVLREKIRNGDEILLGVVFSLIGMALFTLGIFLALDPLGAQVGKDVAATFTEIKPYGLAGTHGPLYMPRVIGEIISILFAFFLGYGATLAEPALNALGVTVEKITVGAFKKGLLMQSVAMGVGVGIALGVAKIIYDLPLTFMLIPPYMVLLFITYLSTEDFVNFAWDSAGVTTGPITVPLVLAIGLGIGGTVGALEGFGVLAMASVCPILSVLLVGLWVKKTNRAAVSTAEGV